MRRAGKPKRPDDIGRFDFEVPPSHLGNKTTMRENCDMEKNRQNNISIAISFSDENALRRLGSGCVLLQCPECGAQGKRYGNPREEMRFEGFEPLSSGGRGHLLARCLRCAQEVLLPHRSAK
jgi:hypothetical protein